MATVPFPWTDFGGLDLRSEADSTGGAIDLLNVDLDKPGAVRTRDGYSIWTAAAAAAYDILFPFYRSLGTTKLMGGRGHTVVAISGGSESHTQATANDISGMARLGTATAEAVYIANGSDTLWKFTGAAFSQPAGLPQATCLAVATTSNRLVAGRDGSSVSRVRFSNPGAPDTFGANNYVDLDPGDGGQVWAACNWREQVFVFKDRSYFVFYGESTDGSGNPEFSYRPIRTGIGVANSKSVAVGPEGVYFVTANGDVYLTTGGPPTLISAQITAFTRLTASYVTLPGSVTTARYALAYADSRLYMLMPSTPALVFVYDTVLREWLLWDVDAASITGYVDTNDTVERLWFGHTTTKTVARVTTSETTDAGAGITARWRSPYVNLARQSGHPIPDQEVGVNDSILNGTGTVGFSMARDWATSLPTSAGGAKRIVKLGTSYPKEGRHRKSQRGRAVSFQFETPTASDSFGSNTIANYTADSGATTNVSITGGVMAASANLSTNNRLILTTGTFTDFGDCVAQAKVTVGGTLSGFLGGVVFKRVDSSNSLSVRISDDGATSSLIITKRVAGVITSLATQALTRLTTTTAYWVRARIEENVITAEHFTSNPSSAVAAASTTYTLTGSEATTFGSGIVGKTGLNFTPIHSSASLDDFSVVGGPWKVEDVTMQLTGFRAPALQTTA